MFKHHILAYQNDEQKFDIQLHTVRAFTALNALEKVANQLEQQEKGRSLLYLYQLFGSEDERVKAMDRIQEEGVPRTHERPNNRE